MRSHTRLFRSAGWLALLPLVMTACLPAAPGAQQAVSTTTPTASQAELYVRGVDAVGLQAAGTELRLVYSISNPPYESAVIYAATPSDLTNRISLAEVDHQAGYPPEGKISPDGKTAAIVVVPSGAGERAARTNGSEIWLVGMDGSSPRLLAQGIGFLGGWSPDERNLAAGRYLPVETGMETVVPDRVELVDVDVASGAQRVIRTEDGQAALRGLGWSADSARYLTAYAGGESWSIDAWNRETASLENVLTLPAGKSFTSISLAPDGMNLLLVEQENQTDKTSLLPLDGREQQILNQVERDGGSRSGISAVWNAAGNDLLLFSGTGGNRQVTRPLAAVNSAQVVPDSLPAAATANPGLVPLSWSPDGAWLVYRDYADPMLPLLLQDFSGGELVRIDPLEQSGMITFIGWMKP